MMITLLLFMDGIGMVYDIIIIMCLQLLLCMMPAIVFYMWFWTGSAFGCGAITPFIQIIIIIIFQKVVHTITSL